MTKATIKRIKEIDYLRGFAILGVIMIHTTTNVSKIEEVNLLLITNIFLNILSIPAVPLFILISGTVLALKYKKHFPLQLFYKKRALSVAPQYLIFSILYLVPSYIYGRLPNPDQIIFKLATGSCAVHLWFFILIIQLYLLYPFIIRLYEHCQRKNQTRYILIISLLIQISWHSTLTHINMNTADTATKLILGKIFLSHIFYFMIGIYAGKNIALIKEKILNSKILHFTAISVTIAIILSAFQISSINAYEDFERVTPTLWTLQTILNPALIISIIIVLSKLSLALQKSGHTIISRIIEELGNHSYGIYLIHMFFLRIVFKTLIAIEITYSDWIFYPTLFICTIILSYISTALISYMPHSNLIIGIHKKTTSYKIDRDHRATLRNTP